MRRGHRPDLPADDNPATEGPVVRRYRFLLRAAPPDAVEAAHAEVLPTLGRADRRAVLEAVRRGMSAGWRLTEDDTTKLAHLVVAGEHRAPGAFLRACEPSTLQVLAAAVVDSESVFGLFGGYAAWDGLEPVPDPGTDDSPFAEKWHVAQTTRVMYRTSTGAPLSPDQFGPPGL